VFLRAHLEKHKCELKTFNGYVYFGKWSKITENKHPIVPCSFCARFYEWEHKMSNGWPLSVEKIRQIANNDEPHIVPRNNKFAKIFGTELKKELKKQICICSEISRPHPSCKVHEIYKDTINSPGGFLYNPDWDIPQEERYRY
jgi:hypothetical protein